jgi:hypothetical protein
VLEASAGYGKSVLAAELVNAWGAVPVDVVLEEGGVVAPLLASRLRAAVGRAGFVDAAASMAAAGQDSVAAIDAMLDALSGESCAIVIDDAHHALRDAGVLIDRIAARLAPPQRLVVAARQLPPGCERLRRADAAQFSAAELALRPSETLEFCRSGFGLEVSPEDGRLLDAATGGWTAAAVLAMSRAKRTAQPLREIAGLGPLRGDALSPVAPILDELISADPARSRATTASNPRPGSPVRRVACWLRGGVAAVRSRGLTWADGDGDCDATRTSPGVPGQASRVRGRRPRLPAPQLQARSCGSSVREDQAGA